MPLTDNLPENLQRRIGPFPVWVWGVALGGGIIAWRMLRGGDEGTESGDAQTVEQIPIGGSDFSDGSGGGFDDTSGGGGGGGGGGNTPTPTPTTEQHPFCPVGYKAVKNAKGQWTCRRVPKPDCKRGYVARWRFASQTWVCVKRRKSFTQDEPHITFAASPNKTVPTITEQNVPAINMVLDTSPRARVTPIYQRQSNDPVVVPSTPPAPMFRSPGRPFHGPNDAPDK